MAKRRLVDALFCLYLLTLLRITVFRDGCFSHALFSGKLVLVPFQTIFLNLLNGESLYFVFLFFGNIIWFLPFGAYLRRRGVPFWLVCLRGFMLSLSIELLQFILGSGTAETEDLILNTLGAALGYGGISLLRTDQSLTSNAKSTILSLTTIGATLATAESCTGGLLGAALTEVPGASAVYLGGVVSYAYAVKEELLDVSHELLAQKGAVCEEVACQMAEGVRKKLGADYGIGITGNAGPSADPVNPNVGEIFVACAAAGETRCKRLELHGDRQANRIAACQAALELLLDRLTEQN